MNVARGSVVDETALIEALESRALGGAALDVFADEPNVPERLRALPQVVLMPHIGSATNSTRGAMAGLAVENLRAKAGGGDRGDGGARVSVSWGRWQTPHHCSDEEHEHSAP